MTRVIKTTILGAILFIVPIAIIGKALELTNIIAVPLAQKLIVYSGGDRIVVHVVALVILLLCCFLAGLAAKTSLAGKIVRSLETNVLEKIPAYDLIKAKTQSVLTPDEIKNLRPAMTRFDDSWQLVFEIERLADGKVVVFSPDLPIPAPARFVSLQTIG
jgi:hypothetical protein